MKIVTRKFGEIKIDEKKILSMPEGLPGFPGFEQFILLEDPKSAPFCWFQSIEDPNLALVIMNPYVFEPGYKLDLEDLISSVGWGGIKTEDLQAFVVINIIGEGKDKKITANLIGPIIINPMKKEAFQVVISNSKYTHQHNIL